MIKKVLTFKNPILRKKSKAIKKITKEIKELINNMFDTMYEFNGVGLAAIQIGEPLRLVVLDVSEKGNEPLVLINPKIVEKIGQSKSIEGCLSVPGFEGEVIRASKCLLKAKNEKFEDIQMQIEGLLSVAIQHELDHLEGVLYIDKVEKNSLKPVNIL